MAALIGVLVGGGLLYGIGEAYYRLRGVEGMGMGDVKMLAMIGAFLGWQLVLVTLIVASFGGAVLGVALLATRPGHHAGGAAVRHLPGRRAPRSRPWPASRWSPGIWRSTDERKAACSSA